MRGALIDYRLFKSLKRILIKMSEAKHGTTLIFGFKGNPKDKNLFQPGAIELKIPYGSNLLELEFPRAIVSDDSKDKKLIELINIYEKAIISLSKTDGAMIFNQNLDLILAGAFLKTKSSASLTGGARRKSAEGFIRDNPDTIAIVISQDGSITLLPKVVIGE